MSDEKKTDELVVKAGSIQVLTQVGAGKAWVDVPQGERVPDDISDEDRKRFLDSGAIGKTGDAAYVAAARPVAGEVEPDEIDKDVIPAGSVEQILAWVGDDLARARVAADMEEAKGPKARANLLKKLADVKADTETEPPAVPESYDATVQPAPAGGVVTPVDDSADTGSQSGPSAKPAPAKPGK
jgi:hypothetical protein